MKRKYIKKVKQIDEKPKISNSWAHGGVFTWFCAS